MGAEPRASALSLETGWVEAADGPIGQGSPVLPALYLTYGHRAFGPNEFPPVAGCLKITPFP